MLFDSRENRRLAAKALVPDRDMVLLRDERLNTTYLVEDQHLDREVKALKANRVEGVTCANRKDTV